jgi:hypothetical protein
LADLCGSAAGECASMRPEVPSFSAETTNFRQNIGGANKMRG